jgi:isocitrate dehydrogenase (NAD+)
MMLDDIGEFDAAKRIENAVAKVVEEGKHVTRDINPESKISTQEFTDAICEEMK